MARRMDAIGSGKQHGARDVTIHTMAELARGMCWNIPYSTRPKLTAASDRW